MTAPASPTPSAPAGGVTLEELRRLSDAATSGEWRGGHRCDGAIRATVDGERVSIAADLSSHDAALASAAVNYVRALLATPADEPKTGATVTEAMVEALNAQRFGGEEAWQIAQDNPALARMVEVRRRQSREWLEAALSAGPPPVDAGDVERLPTIKELDASIREIIGHAVYDSINGIGRPRLHEMAMLRCFTDAREDEHAARLRVMFKELSKKGFYPPECWGLGDDAGPDAST